MSTLESILDEQVATLVRKGYPERVVELARPLRAKLAGLELPALDIAAGTLPFVLVVKSSVLPTEQAMTAASKDSKPGITKLFPLEPGDFTTIDAVTIPESDAYLLVDIDRGNDSVNLPPSAAFEIIAKRHRSPLTIDEGIALVTQHPEALIKNHCFSLLASRHTGDQRVPAIWINGQKNPNLGWCWNGNPHTWLGSASCARRIGA